MGGTNARELEARSALDDEGGEEACNFVGEEEEEYVGIEGSRME